ncbi:adenine phosphoribosyltransferase [Contarinia nasturtii]|uniref:adenine phosphoribosyltransferase n=1 Tax=Contarinia nasturtii TaxID=265458 RepID=UPI0012D4911D|nr:adenine phosphoribosyltransferase [Contarinia nasturtii]XP_031617978.1 adenine phosphoribosyltransferase [Contarinia nasturtii]XP_031617979.1 adenine phosphoribosyltransferase [Contarinia nasturtii]XP_031617980.1 adenine phosphoribosyltransferase [Contarinia nasturtii]
MAMDEQSKLQLIKEHIGEFVDFPKEGIVFRDIFTSLLDGRVCTAIRDLLIERVKKANAKIDAIVGLDARGFLFGFTISAELGIPFVPIRKKGKLPGKCRSYEYTLEYGSGTLEIQENSVQPGQNVIIIDDLLATGGTLNAANQLVTNLGANVIEIIVIMELKSLNGRANIPSKNIHALIEYD